MNPRPSPRRGHYDDPFWDHVSRRDLRLQRCTDCGRLRYPPGPACPACLGEGFTWGPVSGHGTTLSWVTFHREYFTAFPPPHVVVAAELAEGPILITDLAGAADASGLRVGTPLRLGYELVDGGSEPDWTIFRWHLAAP